MTRMGRWRGLARQMALERRVYERAALREVGLEVEAAHASPSGSQENGLVPSAPCASLARISIRFSASSRYFAHRRARAIPSSKDRSDSSSGRLPLSSWLTICSRRSSESSNLRSVILVPRPRDPAVEASLVEQLADVVPRPHRSRAPHDRAGGGARETIAAAEHGQRRERVELAHQRPQPAARLVAAPRDR